MGHGHEHGKHDHSSTGNLKTAFLLNAGFTVIEIIGGLWTNSIAILSDAVHDLGDSISLGLAWYFDKVSKKGATSRDTYGYRRYSLLGGLITAIVLLIGLSFVLWQAASRLLAPEDVNAPGMMLLAAIGVAFNGAAVLRVRKGSSLTEKVVSWHLLEDTLGWVAVLVGAAVMTLWDLPVIDPLLSIGISLFVLWNVLRNLRQFLDVFLQKTPKGFDIGEFERAVLSEPSVVSMHHTHSWSIDGERHVLTTHLVLKESVGRQEILQAKERVRRMLDEKAFVHLTVDVEIQGENCLMGSDHKDFQSESSAGAHPH